MTKRCACQKASFHKCTTWFYLEVIPSSGRQVQFGLAQYMRIGEDSTLNCACSDSLRPKTSEIIASTASERQILMPCRLETAAHICRHHSAHCSGLTEAFCEMT